VNLKAELEAVVDALTRAQVEFAICGGIAGTIHGAPRFTKDLDFLVPGASVERALCAAREVGYDLPARPMVFDAGTPRERRIQRVTKIEGEESLTLDLVLVEPSLADVWAGRQEVEWEGRKAMIVSRSGLVAMKRLAGRDQNLVDIRRLEEGGDA